MIINMLVVILNPLSKVILFHLKFAGALDFYVSLFLIGNSSIWLGIVACYWHFI